jgi:hypothetical protein
MAYLDRDLPQLGLSKQVACRTPIFRASGGAARPQPPPSPFFLLEIDAWVVDGYSSALVRSLGSIGQRYIGRTSILRKSGL